MKLRDLQVEAAEMFTFEITSEEKPTKGEIVQLYVLGDVFAAYSQNTSNYDQAYYFDLKDQRDKDHLILELSHGNSNLAEIIAVTDDQAIMQVFFFVGPVIELDEIEVAVSDEFEAQAIESKYIKTKKKKVLCENLDKLFNIKGAPYFVIMAGPVVKDDLNQSEAQTLDSCFTLISNMARIPVDQRKLKIPPTQVEKEIYWGTKAVFGKQNTNGYQSRSYRLVRGKVCFKDWTQTGRIQGLASGMVKQLIDKSDSYLKAWDKYGAKEGEILLKKLRSIGHMNYNKANRVNGGFELLLTTPVPKDLAVGDMVEFVEELPDYLSKESEITWEEYRDSIVSKFKANQQPKSQGKDPSIEFEERQAKKAKEMGSCKILKKGDHSLTIETQFEPPLYYHLIYSALGEQVQIQRRETARQMILNGQSGMPMLGVLIEDGAQVPIQKPVTKIKPLSHFVKTKIFAHEPTIRQVEAIEIALNTPDIVLIQGPPGTGKTTVITAILERLNQLQDNRKSMRGQILVSGYQHDAVENLVSRLTINELPAIKFGSRSKEDDPLQAKVEYWCEELAGQLREKNPKLSETEQQVKLITLAESYEAVPTDANALKLINDALAIDRRKLTSDLVEDLLSIKNDLQGTQKSKSDRASILNVLWALRVDLAAFMDDGPQAIMKLNDLHKQNKVTLSTNQQDLLKKLMHALPNKAQFQELELMRDQLIEQYSPRPVYRVSKPREDILLLADKLITCLKQQVAHGDATQEALVDLLNELETNPYDVQESLKEYTYVFGATTGQSVGKQMRIAKDLRTQNIQNMLFDTVIIDEAARTSPRDLMIPLVLAKKRIILVGDHRQLPHMIDEEVARQLEQEFEEESKNSTDSEEFINESDYIKESMFAYLFKRLKQLEQDDGIRRTVTLDAQYRTHPQLGNLCSKHFYEKHKEGYKSPLGPEFFRQNLPFLSGKAMAWIDTKGKARSEKVGTSLANRGEAQAVAEWLKYWMDHESGKDLSFGVITFYSGQVKLIKQILSGAKYGMTKQGSSGDFEFTKKYKSLRTDSGKVVERLRVGTVDAFQGMEFDVVLLSIVRHHQAHLNKKQKGKKVSAEKRKAQLFGFLSSPNRLCVSMSRQKKALVIVGDSNLVQLPEAKKAISVLSEFYDICVSENSIFPMTVPEEN